MNNPYASSIVEIEKLRNKIGLVDSILLKLLFHRIENFLFFVYRIHITNIEEQVINLVNDINCHVTLSEFALRLQISAYDPATITLFSLFKNDESSDVIDFREYLLCALFLLRISDPTIVLLESVFKVNLIMCINPS